MNKPKPLPLLVLALALAIGFSLLLSQSGGDAGGGAPIFPSAVGVEEVSEPGRADLPGLSSGGESRDIAPRVMEDGPSLLQPEALSGLGFAGRTDKRIRGRVVDSLGDPVEGAKVSVQPGFGDGAFAFNSGERSWVETDADGQFEVERVVFDQLSVEVRATGYAKLKETVPFTGEDLGTFELEPGVVVRGVVVDAQGLPVEGAAVSFAERSSGLAILTIDGWGEPDTKTAADGSFELATGLIGPWQIEAHHELHPTGTVEGESDRAGLHPELVTVRLPLGDSISGHIEGAHSGIEYFVLASPGGMAQDPWGMDSVRRRAVDADGQFELHGLIPETDYNLELMGGTEEDGFFGEPLSDTVLARAGETGVVLRLRASKGISFRVIHQDTRAPIEQFTAKAGGWWTEPLQDAEGTILTEHEGGRAVFEEVFNLDKEDARLQIFSDGFEPYELGGIQLPVEGLLDLGDIALKPAPLLKVKVLADGSSLPVEGARVTLSVPRERDAIAGEFSRSVESHENPQDARMENRSKRTDAAGVVTLTTIPGQRTALTVSHRKFAELKLPARPYGAEEVVVRLLVGGEVRVTLLDADGAPVARGVSVDHRFAKSQEEGSFEYGSKHTSSKGVATFKHLNAGTHEFRAGRDLGTGQGFIFFEGAGSGGEEDAEPWVSVEVSEGSEQELVLRRAARATLFGRVTEGGRPLPRATLRLEPWRADSAEDAGNRAARMVFFDGGGGGIESGSDGSYRMEERPVGEYQLIVSHPRRAMDDTFRVTLTPGEVELDVDLPATAIEGIVVDQEGEPVEGLEVVVRRAEDPSAGGVGMGMIVGMGGFHVGFGGGGGPTRTDAAGRFEVRGLATGCELVLELSGGKYQTKLIEIDPLRPGDVRGDLRVVVTEGGGIDLRVIMADGREPEFASLMLRKLIDGEPEGELRHDGFEGGRKLIEGLSEGEWWVKTTVFDLSGVQSGEEPAQVEREEIVSVRPGEVAEVLIQY